MTKIQGNNKSNIFFQYYKKSKHSKCKMHRLKLLHSPVGSEEGWTTQPRLDHTVSQGQWEAMCRLRLDRCLYCFPQTEQLNGLTPVCTHRWLFRLDF